MEIKSDKQSLGNRINNVLINAQSNLFTVGRTAQLAYSAFSSHVENVEVNENGKVSFEYPVGQNNDGTVIPNITEISKEEYIDEFNLLASYTLPMTGITNLVMSMEVMIEDLVSEILMTFPQKFGKNKKVSFSYIFDYDSLEEARRAGIKELLSDLFYSSPKEIAEMLENVFSFSLLEIPQFLKYLELKATRDIHVHSRRIANEAYTRKAGVSARVESGEYLPVTIGYFLHAHETCLRLVEKLEDRFHSVWPSSEYDDKKLKASNKSEEATL